MYFNHVFQIGVLTISDVKLFSSRNDKFSDDGVSQNYPAAAFFNSILFIPRLG